MNYLEDMAYETARESIDRRCGLLVDAAHQAYDAGNEALAQRRLVAAKALRDGYRDLEGPPIHPEERLL